MFRHFCWLFSSLSDIWALWPSAMCSGDSMSQSTCFFSLTVTHFNPSVQRRDAQRKLLLSCESSNWSVSSCFQLLPVRQTRLFFLTNMPLEWEETRSLSREIKEVMLSSLYAVVCISDIENATLLIWAVVRALAPLFSLFFILWMTSIMRCFYSQKAY